MASADATAPAGDSEAHSLVEAIEILWLEKEDSAVLPLPKGFPVQVVRSSVKVDLDHRAKYIHGDVVDGDVFLLSSVARQSAEKISNGQSEIPDGLSQGDLYSQVLLRPDRVPVMAKSCLPKERCARWN